jgi:MFS family permease
MNKEPEKGLKWSALLIAGLSAFLTTFVGSSINIALPHIGETFHMDAITLNWSATSFLLASAMFLVPFGRLADMYGRKKFFAIGISIFTVACGFSALAADTVQFIASRVLNGIGAAMIFGTGMAILTSVFPPHQRGMALGINVAAVYVGLTLGPFAGGMLTHYLGWRSIFWINIPLLSSVLLILWWKIKGEWAFAKGQSFDLLGSVLFSFSLFGIILGFTFLPDWWAGFIILGGVVGLFVFIRYELVHPSPVLNLNLFRNNPAFLFSNLAAFINYSATFGVSFLMSLYLQYIKGFTPETAGLIMFSQPAVMAVFSPLAGFLSDRIEPRIVATLGMAISTVGLTMLIFLAPNTTLYYIFPCLMVLGFGFALFSSPNTNAIMSSVEKRFYGIASGTVGTMRLTGQMFSMGIIMVLFAITIGREKIEPPQYPQFLESATVAFLIFAILCGLGIGASLLRGSIRSPK